MIVAVDPDTMVDGEILTVDRDKDTAPAITVTVGSVEVTALPPIVAETVVAVPAVVPVNVALYVPFPLSFTLPIVPLEVPPPVSEKATVSPPVVKSLPAPSFAWSVIVAVDPDAIVDGEIVTTD